MADTDDELQKAIAESDQSAGVGAPYSCDVCGEPFQTSQQKASHVRSTGHKKDTAPDRDASAPAPKPRASSLEKRLTELFVGVGTMVLPFDQFCGAHVIRRAPHTAGALDALAKENPSIRKALEGLLETSAWGGVIVNVAILLIPIMAHHKMIPGEIGERLAVAIGAQQKQEQEPPEQPPAAA